MSASWKKDALAALSIANLSLAKAWNELLNYTPADSFFFERPPALPEFAELAAAVVGLGIVFYSLIRIARWLTRKHGYLWSVPVLILIALPPGNAMREVGRAGLFGITRHGTLLAVLACAAGIVVLIAFGPRTLELGTGAARLFLPLLVIELALAAGHKPLKEFTPPPLAPLASHGPAFARVVWVIFDDLDYRLLFPDRPSGLRAPAFDRLREESLFATNALSPSLYTKMSIPALLTGVPFLETTPTGPASLWGRVEGSPRSIQVHDLPTVFSSVRQMNGNVAVVGWHLPYSRLFGKDLSACTWTGFGNILNSPSAMFAGNVERLMQTPFESDLASPFPHAAIVLQHIRALEIIQREMLRAASNPAMDLVFLHLPIPHPPHIYDRSRRAFGGGTNAASGYPDSEALADQWLGEIRAAMTDAGLWDRSTLIVSSDHHFREDRELDGKQDPRVPFLLRVAGQTSGRTYNPPLHTIVTKSLIEAVFADRIKSPDDAAAWLTADPRLRP